MRYLFFLFPALFLFGGCNHQKNESAEFTISGNFSNAANISIQLEELTTRDLLPVDSTITDEEGGFSFTHMIAEAGFYILRINSENFITLLIEPGEKVRLVADASDLAGSCQIKGSPGSSRLASLNNILAANYSMVDSLKLRFHAIRSQDDFHRKRKEIESAYSEIFEQQKQLVKDFIVQNPRSLASVIALYKYFGNQLLLNENDDFEYFESLSQSLSEAYPGNTHVLDLSRRVNEYRRSQMQRQLADASLAVGTVAPEIVLPDPDGNPLALSSFRGKVVMIDFWAAWCPPCRQVNPRLKQIYKKYKPLGFEIYGISLDRTREQWLAGIQEDQISWPQVSDLRFWSSPVVNLYNVEGIPYAVLIDQEGKIVSKGFSLNQLEEILGQMLR